MTPRLVATIEDICADNISQFFHLRRNTSTTHRRYFLSMSNSISKQETQCGEIIHLRDLNQSAAIKEFRRFVEGMAEEERYAPELEARAALGYSACE